MTASVNVYYGSGFTNGEQGVDGAPYEQDDICPDIPRLISQPGKISRRNSLCR